MLFKTFFVVLILIFTSYAISLKSVSIYATPLMYKSSINKKNGFFTGTYIYFGYGYNHSLEGEVDYIKINFKNGKTLNQFDFSLAYTYFSNQDKIRIGTHLIKNNEANITPSTDTGNGIIFFVGYSKYKLYSWEICGEGYVSYYKNYKVINNTLKVFQINGIFSYGQGNFYRTGRTYIFLKPYLIYLPDSPTRKNTYISLEGGFSYYIKNWVFSGSGYVGKILFPVKNGGFLVYNVAEERLSGLGVGVRYFINKNYSVFFNLYNENFYDELSSNKASLLTTLLGANIVF